MRRTRLVTTTGMMLLAVTGIARGQTSGLYIAAGAGVNLRQDADLTLKGDGATTAGAVGVGPGGRLGFTDVGPVAVGALGWGFGNGFRAEAELNYRSNDVGSLSVNGFGSRSFQSGTAYTYGVMANLFYDVGGLGWRAGVPVAPYVGLGIGYAWSGYRQVMLRSGNDGLATYGTDGQFAYQAIAGLAWSLSNLMPGLALTTEYRYFGVLDQTINVSANLGTARLRGTPVETSNGNHAFLIGLRYAFNTPY